MKISHKWLTSYFEKEIPSAEKVEELLSVRSFEPEGIEAVNEDSVLDFDVLPNRAHDALSHKGIARELSAVLGEPLKTDRYGRREVEEISDMVSVEIQDTHKCRRYVSRVIKNVKVNESPDWIRERLEAVGQKSINNIVDSTNYVMFDLGQPMHAFDLDKLNSGITIRNAKDGEQITTLTGEEKKLSTDDLVIADSESPLAIAGIKGGKKAEVDTETVNIVLESASFDPLTTRLTSRRVGIQNDSSKRFENEPTRELCLEAIERTTDLILEFCPDAKIGPIVDEYPAKQESAQAEVSLEDINSLIGVDISVEKVSEILNSLELVHTESSRVFTVSIPDFRLDLRIKQDLIEEVARMYGFENIPAKLPEGFDNPKINKGFYYAGVVRQALVKAGFLEVYTYALTDKGKIKTMNSVAADKNYLRANLYKGMSDALNKNINNRDLLGVDELQIFEIGTVFKKEGEYTALGLGHSLMIHKKEKIRKRGEDLINEYLKGLEESLGLNLDNYKEGVEDGVLQINFSKLIEDLPEPTDGYTFDVSEKSIKFKDFSLLPSMSRDVSVWLPGKNSRPKLESILAEADLMIREPRMVDEFEKEGRVSYLYRLVFQATDRTLTDDEINTVMDPVYEKIKEKSDWELR
jgi:phenylalanyl-tRNA synthetase beta chain